jgi:Na+-translocating ferredoxin:NAD+ oxidoreductase RnfD subunit
MKRFFRTPKGLLTIVLSILLAWAVPATGWRAVLPALAVAALASMAVDGVILRIRNGGWEFPSGSLLTAAIVSMILSPQEPWWVAAVTSVIGIVAKYLFRQRTANIFNPAALGLVATFYLFDTGQSWWGALTEAGPFAVLLLIAGGVFITNRVNKFPIVLAFLGSYFLLFTISAFVGDSARLVEIYRTPDLQAVLYFAFFIVTDPPTSPNRYPHQVINGALIGLASYVVFETTGAAHYLLSGVLVGNVAEAWRRR